MTIYLRSIDTTMKVVLFGDDISLLNRWERFLVGYDVKIAGSISDGDEVVVVDFDSVGKSLLEYLKRGEGRAGARFVALQSAPKIKTAEYLLAAGVRGYGNSYMQRVHFLSCIETVEEGNIWLFPEFVYSLVGRVGGSIRSDSHVDAPYFVELLSPREKELYSFLLDGKSNSEIADIMGITVRTVKAHLGNIYEKAGVNGRVELVLKAKGM